MPVSDYALADGFERNDDPTFGFAKWTGTHIDPGGTITYSTLNRLHGKYACRASLNASLSDKNCALGKGITINPVHIVAIVVHDEAPPVGGDQRTLSFTQGLTDTQPASNAITSAGIINDGGTVKWLLRYRSGGAFTNVVGDPMILNKRYCLELAMFRDVGGAGWASFWVNNKLQASVTNLTHTRQLNYACIGFVYSDSNAVNTTNVYHDCVRVSKRKIGCENVTRLLRSKGGEAVNRTRRGLSGHQGRLYIR